MPDPKTDVQIPTKARSAADDLLPDIQALLRGVQLLPEQGELAEAGKAKSAFVGTPDSVVLIEAGATALSKWWAAGLGAAVVAAWPTVVNFWDDQPEANRRVIAIALSIATAAAIVAIGYIVGSDVRGRSAAAVATIEGRAQATTTMMRLADGAYQAASAGAARQVVALPVPLPVRLGKKTSDTNETGWRAIAMAVGDANATEYLCVKATAHEWTPGEDVEFV